MSEDKIKPVIWRTPMPGLANIDPDADQNDPAWVDKQRNIAADEAVSSEKRFIAMGYLVALQNKGKLEATELIQFFEKIARASEKPQSQTRRDALFAIAHFKDEQDKVHSEARARLIELAKDRGFQQGRRDTLAALARTCDPAVLDLLVTGVVEFGGWDLAEGVRRIDCGWQDKTNLLIHALQSSSRLRNQLDISILLQALRTPDEPPTRRLEMEDLLIEAARDPKNQDVRMSGILAGLLIALEAGDAEQAGHRINAYERDHNVPENELRNLRLQVGGPALSAVLQQNLETQFQKPIHELNKTTLDGWQRALDKAHFGFSVRLWMSFTVFVVGVLLLSVSSYTLLFGAHGRNANESLATFAAGLGTMLLVLYAGPLKDIRQSVSDLATVNAVFIAYVHRIYETSLTFSYCYLHEQISFEQMAKSSALIREAMENAVRSFNMTAVDSSEDVIVRAMTFATDKLKLK